MFSHVLYQLRLHQPCGEKEAIFIHIYSRPITIFAEKTETKGDLVTWTDSRKEWKPGSKTLGECWVSHDSSEMIALTCVYYPIAHQALSHPSHHVTGKGPLGTSASMVATPEPGSEKVLAGMGIIETPVHRSLVGL